MAMFCSQSLQQRSTELLWEQQQFTSLNQNSLKSTHTHSTIFFFALHKEMDPVPTPMLVFHQFLSPKTKVSVRAKAGFIFWSQALDLPTALALLRSLTKAGPILSSGQQSVTAQLARGAPHWPETGKGVPFQLILSQVPEKY